METEKSEEHFVQPLNYPIRIQEYGVGIFIHAPTKSALKKALKKQFITVNDAVATTATFIKGGETIRLVIPAQIPPKKQLKFPLKILFEDDCLAAIYKPAGILVSGNSFKTITNALEQNLTPSTAEDATTPQPVHRLDYATTGILLIGKTSSSIRALGNLFEERKLKKTYLAITIGNMPSTGTITSEVGDKMAQSDYTVLETVPSGRFGILNLVKLNPESGRRHQLRIHLSSIGNPILGDKDYGIEGLILTGKGMYLHAHTLNFEHPFTQEKLNLKADLPEKFNTIFNYSNE